MATNGVEQRGMLTVKSAELEQLLPTTVTTRTLTAGEGEAGCDDVLDAAQQKSFDRSLNRFAFVRMR
jgi:hypothetical protein